jgi:hypothetical protein
MLKYRGTLACLKNTVAVFFQVFNDDFEKPINKKIKTRKVPLSNQGGSTYPEIHSIICHFEDIQQFER